MMVNGFLYRFPTFTDGGGWRYQIVIHAPSKRSLGAMVTKPPERCFIARGPPGDRAS